MFTGALLLVVLAGFVYLSPLSYGTPGLEPDAVNRRRILSSWTLHFVSPLCSRSTRLIIFGRPSDVSSRSLTEKGEHRSKNFAQLHRIDKIAQVYIMH